MSTNRPEHDWELPGYKKEEHPCENCGAGQQYTLLIDADGSSQNVCKLCADTWQMAHRRMVLHCFNRVLEQLRKLK